LFQYEEVSTKVEESSSTGQTTTTSNLAIEVQDGTLMIKHPNFGRVVTMDGAVYQAYEIRIHTPAEHRINYKKYDMEIQVIHRGITVGDIAKQVVLSFVFEKKAGSQNKLLDDIDFFNLPSALNTRVELHEKLILIVSFTLLTLEMLLLLKTFRFTLTKEAFLSLLALKTLLFMLPVSQLELDLLH